MRTVLIFRDIVVLDTLPASTCVLLVRAAHLCWYFDVPHEYIENIYDYGAGNATYSSAADRPHLSMPTAEGAWEVSFPQAVPRVEPEADVRCRLCALSRDCNVLFYVMKRLLSVICVTKRRIVVGNLCHVIVHPH